MRIIRDFILPSYHVTSLTRSLRKLFLTSDELDHLSPAGKKFMEQLPDLSYMLKSTLVLPDN
jgi:hypothetical protein